MKKSREKPGEILRLNLLQLLNANNINEIPNDIPTKWERHGDLILIPSHSLQHAVWVGLGCIVWDTVAQSLACERIARKHRIVNDDFRSPCTKLLRGSDRWVTRVDNGIKCTFDVTKCMFSAGNITEKLHIAKLPCENEVVVDLYAGIGYFTLPFLVHAKALRVHACEWNPYSVEALERNLTLNGVEGRCVVHSGDNRKVCPKGVADRVNLGLIPSSEPGWKTACSALKRTTGGVLHLHGVVTSEVKVGELTRNPDEQRECVSQDISTDSSSSPHGCEDRHVSLHCVNSSSLNSGHTQCIKKTKKFKTEWVKWAKNASQAISDIFNELYQEQWYCQILHTEHVKSYAPHMDHIVVDIECKPNS